MTASPAPAPGIIRVAPLPHAAGQNPHYDVFYGPLEPFGITRVPGATCEIDWFRQQRPPVDWAHIHFAIDFYNSPSLRLSFERALGFVGFLFRLRREGIRIAWTCHNLFPHESRSRAVDYVVRLALARVARFVLVHSEAARRDVGRYFGRRRRVVKVSRGHYVGRYPNAIGREEARHRLGIPADATVYLLLGNIRPYKGVGELIDAFRQVPDPRARLVLAGNVVSNMGVADRDRYRDQLLAQAAADPRILPHFRSVPEDELQVYFNAADISVLPFKRILTSASLMLAMSFGVPVLVPRIATIMDYVSPEIAYVMEPGEPLATALERAAARRRAGALAAGDAVIRWVERFDWAAGAPTVARLFREG